MTGWIILAVVVLYAALVVFLLVLCKSARINDDHIERWEAARSNPQPERHLRPVD